MKTSAPPFVLPLALAVLAAPADAHFIWIHLVGGEERRVEVLFGDAVYQDSEENLVGYVEGLEAWTEDGEALVLETRPWGLAGTLPPGARVVAARRDMDLFLRPGMDAAVKLDYYAKGALDVDAAGRVLGTRAELALSETPEGELVLRVLFDGEPAPGAEVHVARADSTAELSLVADERGEARLERPASGVLSARARIVVPSPGEVDGRAYAAEHHWAMLTVASVRRDPLPAGGERAAWLHLESVLSTLDRYPADLAGLAGRLTVGADGVEREGEFEVVDGEIRELTLGGEEAAAPAWLAAELLDMVHGRRDPGFAHAALRHAVTAAPRDGHPLGRALRVSDAAGTVYRVVEQRLAGVERREGDTRAVETILATDVTDAGTYLSTHTVRSTFDARSGALLSVETRSDTYREAEGVHLPRVRRLITAADGGERVATIELRNLELVRSEGGPR